MQIFKRCPSYSLQQHGLIIHQFFKMIAASSWDKEARKIIKKLCTSFSAQSIQIGEQIGIYKRYNTQVE